MTKIDCETAGLGNFKALPALKFAMKQGEFLTVQGFPPAAAAFNLG